jgi:hypothetical protein
LAKALPRAAFGKELSENFESAKRAFAEGPLSGTRQSLCRGPNSPSAKKSNCDGAVSLDGVFAEGLYPWPSAKKLTKIFSKKFFAEGYKSLPRASTNVPRQRNCADFF